MMQNNGIYLSAEELNSLSGLDTYTFKLYVVFIRPLMNYGTQEVGVFSKISLKGLADRLSEKKRQGKKELLFSEDQIAYMLKKLEAVGLIKRISIVSKQAKRLQIKCLLVSVKGVTEGVKNAAKNAAKKVQNVVNGKNSEYSFKTRGGAYTALKQKQLDMLYKKYGKAENIDIDLELERIQGWCEEQEDNKLWVQWNIYKHIERWLLKEIEDAGKPRQQANFYSSKKQVNDVNDDDIQECRDGSQRHNLGYAELHKNKQDMPVNPDVQRIMDIEDGDEMEDALSAFLDSQNVEKQQPVNISDFLYTGEQECRI